MKWLSIPAIGLALAGCGDGDAARQSVANDRLIFSAQHKIQAKLRDPASAIFSDIKVDRKTDVPSVCGKVNSRNGFGGMAGSQRFFVTAAMAVIEEDLEPAIFEKLWGYAC